MKLTQFIVKKQSEQKDDNGDETEPGGSLLDSNANQSVKTAVVEVDNHSSSDPTDADDESDEQSQPSKPKKVKREKKTHRYQKGWEKTYSWLEYDSEKNLMFCSICREAGKTNSFTSGTSNFRVSTLSRHIGTRTKKVNGKSQKIELACDHKEAVKENAMAKQFDQMRDRALDDQERAVVVTLKVVYW